MALRSVYDLIGRYGRTRSLERLANPGPATTTPVKMMERRSDESPMVGEVSQYNLQFYVQHDSLSGAGFPVPPIKGDRVHDGNNRVYTVRSVEDMHDESGNVGGYRMWTRGH
jgi:hypothetical protein